MSKGGGGAWRLSCVINEFNLRQMMENASSSVMKNI